MALYSFRNFLLCFLLYSLHVVSTMANTLPLSASTLCHDHEMSALLHFRQSFSVNKLASYDSSAYPKTESWNASGETSSDCCSWHGVECSDKTGYVIGLHLNSSSLFGTLHSNSSIFTLVHLQILNLAGNNFRNSPIPPAISNLSSLFSLNLSFSVFSGQIPPDLLRLSKLTFLDLSKNKFSGDFPVGLFHLPDLFVLCLSGNQNLTGNLPEFNQTGFFTELKLDSTSFSGNLPVSIGNLQSLSILQLGGCYFSGSIPASIGNLTQLTYLSLSNNMFNSGKLSWLDKLTELTLLDLESTSLHGDLPPSLANLTQLDSLNLGSNYFHGEIPLWLMNMTHLSELILHKNELTGPIPRSFCQLKNLQTLSLYKNTLVGAVDADIFLSLKKLTVLALSHNKITLLTHHHLNFTLPKFKILLLSSCNIREIPYFLRFQNNLEVLFLTENNIHGKIPHWIWNASDHLEAIDLSVNFLTAMEHNPISLPSTSLRVVNVSYNVLQGNLPLPPKNTIMYVVSNNRLTGEIPPIFCSAMSLRILDLSSNNLSGPVPPCLPNSLEALILQDNYFSGTIPQTYTKDCNLKLMDLSRNQLTGKVPKSLSNCKMLQILDLSNNQIEQTFPLYLGTLPRLQVLIMHSNKFHGAMGSPVFPSEFPMLRIIDISHNSLSGDLPVAHIQVWNAMKAFGPDMKPYVTTDLKFQTPHAYWSDSYRNSITLMNKGIEREYNKISNILTAIDLSCNKFTGQIPESFGSLEALQLFNLYNNVLTGQIPPSLGNLRQLESLDLSQNKLSGVIPQQLAAQLTFLAFFNVSCNLLSGRIPQGPQFTTFDNNSFMENSGLCGFPLSKHCMTVGSPTDDIHDNDGDEDDSNDNHLPSGFDRVFILAGVVSGLLVGFVMGNILMDKHTWLVDGIVQNFGGAQKNRRQKRQNFRN